MWPCLPFATIDGNRITIHNIRNCEYRSETDYDVRHYDRTYDLDRLRTADLFLIYWGSPMIAHTMISFGFDGGDYLCVSIETRKEKGEDYSAIRGFFRQYELTYVVADERDVVRLRTNYRHEDVYLYALQTAPDVVRTVFLDYLKHINNLKAKPEWYNALTSNCTTNIRGHARAYVASPWDWRILLNGRIDELAYSNGKLDRSLPFAELKARSRINERAKALDKDPAFSQRAREGLPGMGETPHDRMPYSPDDDARPHLRPPARGMPAGTDADAQSIRRGQKTIPSRQCRRRCRAAASRWSTRPIGCRCRTSRLRCGMDTSGPNRSRFGSCTVEIGRNLSWDDLVRESRTQRRSRSLPLSMAEISELGRFPFVPDLAGFHGATYEESQESVTKRVESERKLVSLLSERFGENAST